MNNAITPAARNIAAFRKMLESVNLEDALPNKSVTADRFARIVLTTLQRTPKVAECNPKSIMACVMESASLGLVPDGLTGQAYLIPYKDTCTLIIGYRGLLQLARNSGQISAIYVYPVFGSDKWKFYQGLNPNIVHEPDLNQPDRENAENLRYVYAVAVFKDGSKVFDVMSRNEVDRIRSRSRAGGSGPWVTDYVEMAKKTVLRRLSKMLPLSADAHRAIAADDATDQGEPQRASAELADFDHSPKVSPLHALVEGDAGDEKGDPAPKKRKKKAKAAEPDDGLTKAQRDAVDAVTAKKAAVAEPERDISDDDVGDVDDLPPAFSDPEPEDGGETGDTADRRQRKTCFSVMRECISVIGKGEAEDIREGNGFGPLDMVNGPIEEVRALTRLLEQAAQALQPK
ncbi:MAG TPA: recombinase RecT [Anaerolineae bacterium]|nr:recombinase RecT [Anaerolineae bacterium]